jgi:hypothetical protein
VYLWILGSALMLYFSFMSLSIWMGMILLTCFWILFLKIMLGIPNVLFNYGRDHEHEHEMTFVGNFRHSSGYVCLSGNVHNCTCDCYSSSFETGVIKKIYANSLKQHKSKSRIFWAHVKVQRYCALYLFTSFNARKFKVRMKVSK